MSGTPSEAATGADRHRLVAAALRELAAEGPVRLTVKGGCMAPRLQEGEQVTVAAARFYWPGDVVAFSSTERLVVHRVLGHRLDAGRLRLQTRADATGTLDPPIPSDRIIGRVTGLRVTLSERLRALARLVRLRLAGRLPQ